SPVEALANESGQVAAGGAGMLGNQMDDELKLCGGEGPTADPHRFGRERGHEAFPFDASKSSACMSAGTQSRRFHGRKGLRSSGARAACPPPCTRQASR